MPGRDDPATHLLRPAIQAARTALRKREPDDVPLALLRVVASTGKRLPPPLVATLLDVLDDDEQLRTDAIEQWADVDAESAVAEVRASSLYLLRTPGWSRKLLEEVAVLADLRVQQASDALESESVRLSKELVEAKKRLKSARAAARADTKRLAGEIETLRREAVAPRIDAVAGDVRESLTECERNLAATDATLVEAQHAVKDLAGRLRVARNDRSRAMRQLASGGDELTRDPIVLARRLDAMAAMARRRTEAPADPPAKRAPVLVLPAGTRPDRAEAITHLLGLRGGFRLIVDGHNMVFRIGDRVDSVARGRVNVEVGKLKRLAVGPVVATVVYDSSLPGPRDPGRAVSGLDVRFAPEDSIADDEIVDLVEAGRTVVITDDRLLRERAEHAGALAIWSEALADWIKR